MPPKPPARSRPRRLGWSVGLPLGALALGALWSGGWVVGSRMAGQAFDDWLGTEAAAGRQWTCPGHRIDGYPFALAVHCERPTFRGEIAGHDAAGTVEALAARVGLDHPGSVRVGLRGPLNLRAADDSFALDVSWDTMTVAIEGVTGTPQGGAVAARRLAVTLATPDGDNLNLRVAALEGEAHPAADVPGGQDFGFTAAAVSFPTSDAIPGLEGPATTTGRGVLTHADLLQAPSTRFLEAWRQAGGALRVDSLRLDKGPFSGSATGTLGLDEAHRAAGTLDTTLAGFAPVAARFGIPLAGVQLGGMLANLLAGGKATPAPAGALQLPLVLANGRLAVGPFTTGVRLLPIY